MNKEVPTPTRIASPETSSDFLCSFRVCFLEGCPVSAFNSEIEGVLCHEDSRERFEYSASNPVRHEGKLGCQSNSRFAFAFDEPRCSFM
jgi:hypothetical protein